MENELYKVVEKAKKYDKLLEFQKGLDELCCSFCYKPQSEIDKLIAGRYVYICNECVDICNEVLIDKGKEIKG